MNIRSPPDKCVIDDFVDQLDNGAVRIPYAFFILVFLRGIASFQFPKQIRKRCFLDIFTEEEIDILQNIFFESHIIFDRLGLQQVFYGIALDDILGIINNHVDIFIAFFKRNPYFPLQIIFSQIFQKITRNGRVRIKRNKTGLIEILEGLTDFSFRHIVFIH